MYKSNSDEDDRVTEVHLAAFEVIGWTVIAVVALYGIAVVIQFALVGV